MGKKAAPPVAAPEVKEEEPVAIPVGEQLEGDFQWQDGSTYSGQYLKLNDDVCLHGKGVLITGPESFNGCFDKGSFKVGKYTACSGAIYNGAFRGSLFHGLGEYQWPDGRTYRGMWKDGFMHGRGQFLNFSFGMDKCHTGFSIEGRFASSKKEQDQMKQRFMDAYCAEQEKSAKDALRDLAGRAGPDGAPKEYFVPIQPEGEEERPELIAERDAAEELVEGPFPDATTMQQAAIQAFVALLDDAENGLVIGVFEDRSSSQRFDGQRLKRDQLQGVGQCVEFTAVATEVGSVTCVSLVNVSTEYDLAKAKWKVVFVDEVLAPA
mmetsp:Transcript_3693/g.9475  ORF Transcript_3693/g.9475 Transcript_3693/m.9475 type:complete len:322 (-) Transcript_3693:109-1074(-)